MKVTVYADCSVVAKLEKTSVLVHNPKFAPWRNRRHMLIRENATDDDALLDITLLRNKQDLITWRRGTNHSPAVSHPLR
jgi:hypothetical protein